jgi:CHRD domain
MKTLTPRRLTAAVTAAALGTMLGAATGAFARDDDDKGNDFSARLSGFNEVHVVGGAVRGAVSTKGSGSFRLKIDERADRIHYELTYQDLAGTVSQAHIHFGQRHTTGGITVWLCETAGTPAPPSVADLTPNCPTPGGTVTGTITAAQILAPTGQGLAAMDFDALIRAIRAGATYANVHSLPDFGPGEIRGQIRSGHGKGR